jgi:hypothetical protein
VKRETTAQLVIRVARHEHSGIIRLALIVRALLVPVSACGSGADSGDRASAPESSTPSKTEEATATPEQVASVIAGAENDWREVIDEEFDCRFSWTMQQDDPADKANRMSCYMREVTVGITAQNAIEALARLKVPGSMTSLVNETTTALDSVAYLQLEAVCGDALDGPQDTKACNGALGQRMSAYTTLKTVLDKWSPYL